MTFNYHFLLYGLLHLLMVKCDNVELSAKLSRIEDGPGLKPHLIVLPCRYFAVTLRDRDGNLAVNATKDDIRVEITGESAASHKIIPVHREILNIAAGRFLLRYKTYSALSGIKISVKLSRSGEEISRSPIEVTESVQPSMCDCPNRRLTLDQWMRINQCPPKYPQMEADFAAFPNKFNMRNVAATAVKFLESAATSFCHYAIVDNRIKRKCYGEHVGFKMFPDSVFGFLAKHVKLPDVEFLINLGDWPLIRGGKVPKIPMISWCKTNRTHDILLPTYEITEAAVECMGRQSLDTFSVQHNSARFKWEDKIEKAFFRGRDSNEIRLKLAALSRENPDLIDAGITRYFFFGDREAELGTKERIPLHDFFEYKYQISVDGTVAAYRLPYLLAGGSLVFKQESPYVEHFYSQLEPWKHFVPLKADLQDLAEKLRWAKSHDEEAKAIAENAKKFANENLLPQHIFCYHGRLLDKIRLKMGGKAEIVDGMEEFIPESHYNACECDKIRDEL